MSWIYIDIEDNEVKIAPEALSFPEVAKVYKRDRRNETKPFFNRVLKYIFHIHSPNHSLSNLFPQQRKERVLDAYFSPDEDISSFDTDKDIQDMVELFKNDSMGPAERFYEGLKKDMEGLIGHIQGIPMFTTIQIEKTVDVEWLDDEAKKHLKSIVVRVPVEHDNSKTKMDALKRADELLELEEKMRNRVKTERRKSKQSRRLFDQ